jgi:hypothetical protein
MMTDREYEILDALYFTVSFDAVKEELETEELTLRDELLALMDKGWVKCMEKKSEAEVEDKEQVKNNYKEYNFLASKTGLIAHNSR